MNGRTTPAGVTPGALAVIGALGVGMAIVRLTGAAAVLLLLVATIVAVLISMVAGWRRLRVVTIDVVTAPHTATTGQPVTLRVQATDPTDADTAVTIIVAGERRTLSDGEPTEVEILAPSPGIVEHLDIELESAGSGGLVVWRRRFTVAIDARDSAAGRMYVAAVAEGPILDIDHQSGADEGSSAAGGGPKNGELDGPRVWRPGEGAQAIHWPSTIRSGQFVAHERESSSDVRWTVDLDSDPARLRRTLEDGLKRHHHVSIHDGHRRHEAHDPTTPDTGETDATSHTVSTNDDARMWSAVAADRRRDDTDADDSIDPARWWQRSLTLKAGEPDALPVPRPARALIGVAALTSLWMLVGALDGSPVARLGVAAGVIVATIVSTIYRDDERPWWARAIVVFIAASALGWIGVQASGVGGLLAALRGPMPDLLMLLVVLHGVEIADKRTARVHVALTGVVVAYSAGLRIDGNVGWWMLAWGAFVIAATTQLEAVRAPNVGPRSIGRVAAWGAIGLVATIGLAAFVPVPDGPASLGLPSISNSDSPVSDSGSLVGPDGSPTPPSTSQGDASRGALGQSVGYPGFSDTLDTSVRGDLGDEVVMRVRAPEPAFWRGQTFTEFDGRVWRVSDVPDERLDGPNISIEPTLGSVPMTDDGVESEEFVQTYTIESDFPNVIFAAARAETVIFDGSVFARSDGAIRADRALGAGTVYSVVSQRIPVTPESLRAQGDLGERFAPFAHVSEVSQFLDLPASTTQETIDLANDLRVEGSTYDTILAYEEWMAINTEYDLDAPVPDGDAVDDFLFNSQRGFCEQIASSLVVMLRSQGVPARLATGYIPGERDRISGVFEVRASDAHAWVEVWFPDSGWEAFDPTAFVPLAGEAERSTVGADAATAIVGGILSRPFHIVGLLALATLLAGAGHALVEWRGRRERGPWGLLHDRFMSLAPDELTPPRVASNLADQTASARPHEVARLLDRVVYDPEFEPDDETLAHLRHEIRQLEKELASSSS